MWRDALKRRVTNSAFNPGELIEAGLGVGGILGVSWWIPSGWQPSHLVFCALFLVVFAVAVRSGTLVAYTTSVLAAFGYGVLLWLRPELRQWPISFYLGLEPFLLLLGGIGSSDLLRWQRQKLARLEQQCTELEDILGQTQQRYQEIVTLHEEQDRQIAGQHISLITLSEQLAMLARLPEQDRLDKLVEVLTSAIEAQNCAVYLRRDGEWRLAAEQTGNCVGHAAVLPTSDPVIKQVLRQRTVCTVRDVLKDVGGAEGVGSAERAKGVQATMQGTAVLAGPLLNHFDELVGVVTLDNLPLLKFNQGSVRLFRALLEIIAKTL